MTTTTPPTERVGRYQLLEPIGIGPSGTVSRAKVFGVAGFERQFAVKRFHAELTATAAMAAMLSAAARAYGSLEHPRIARMSEFGVAQGATFTAVEYVPGLDALRLIAEARLASGAGLVAGGALALVSQAARAVGYAHGRGLTHLGLAPTNVIVTADGDIKITDFGILSASLPQRPIEVARLAQRIPYLAPEQLANEATSAATDVFALGVLAYELVTGTRTFKGDTPQQVASAIMAGPPAEPPLPRPIVRVLQRCLARSPFERFPDARALADALDAALRVAPVPGTRKDIGAQVKDTLDRLAALNEGQMSGMVALHLGTGPIRRIDDDRPPATEPPRLADLAASPYEIGAPDPAGAGVTMSDLPRPMTTVPGLAPPPIPVPPGLGPPSIPPPPGIGTSTLMGMGKAPPPAIPGKRPPSVTGLPPVPPPAIRRGTTQSEPEADGPDLGELGAAGPGPRAVAAPSAAPGPTAGASTESAVHPLDPSDLMSIDAMTDDDVAAAAAGHGADLADATIRASADHEALVETTHDAALAATGDASHEVNAAVNAAMNSAVDAAVNDAVNAAVNDAVNAAVGPAGRDPVQDAPATLSAESSADDFGDAPTHSLAARDAVARVARAPQSGGLFDPIPPRGEPELPAIRRTSTLDEDRWFDEPSANRAPSSDAEPPSSGSGRVPAPASSAGSGRAPASPSAQAGSGRTAVPTPAPPSASGRVAMPMPASPSGRVSRAPSGGIDPLSEPKLNQTILGYAAPPAPARATPPAPFPPAASLPPDRAPEDELPVPSLPFERAAQSPAVDQLSEMMLEGFRTGPAADALEIPPQGWQEPSLITAAPLRPEPSMGPPSQPPGWSNQPQPPTGPPLAVQMPGSSSRRVLWVFVGMLGAVAVAVGAWQLYARVITPSSSGGPGITSRPDRPRAAKTPDPGPVAGTTPGSAAGTAPGSAAVATGSTGSAATRPGAASGSAATRPGATTGSATTAGATTGSAATRPGATTGSATTAGAATGSAATRPGAASGSAAVATGSAGATTGSAATRPGATSGSAAVATGSAGATTGSAGTPPRAGTVPSATPITPGGDSLSIASTPPGARVFLDGADAGVTPLKLPASPDRHTIALLLAGHELYLVQVDGRGSFQIPLKEVTPTNGPAGIKVMRCKDKDRYYIFLDGKPTGQTCPSERIGCELGPHTVEVYDMVSETRRKWDVVVKETRLSLRVRVE